MSELGRYNSEYTTRYSVFADHVRYTQIHEKPAVCLQNSEISLALLGETVFSENGGAEVNGRKIKGLNAPTSEQLSFCDARGCQNRSIRT
jgi:hypothetical protein